MVRISCLVVHHGAGCGAAGHREVRAAVRASAGAAVGDCLARMLPVATTVKPVPEWSAHRRASLQRAVWLAFICRCVGDLGSDAVVRIACLIVHHRARNGTTRHREIRARIRAPAGQPPGDCLAGCAACGHHGKARAERSTHRRGVVTASVWLIFTAVVVLVTWGAAL